MEKNFLLANERKELELLSKKLDILIGEYTTPAIIESKIESKNRRKEALKRLEKKKQLSKYVEQFEEIYQKFFELQKEGYIIYPMHKLAVKRAEEKIVNYDWFIASKLDNRRIIYWMPNMFTYLVIANTGISKL